ncbi:MAG: hypothetical protein HY810_09220 [Candidatus Omnitrophica bacterium]|nr:hypothetical protein [Candidatus Omnitrophota bacterium]
MGIFSEIRRLPEFKKDLEKLSKKRFRTLPEDLENFITTALNSFHKLQIDYGGIVPISDLGIEYPQIYKVTKFACKALKGKGVKSGIRLTYAYFNDKNIIEFIEIYFKGDKENEDRERIKRYYKK